MYGPYGNQRYVEGSLGTDKGYTGQVHDAVTGLDYSNARYYDPVSGQFLSPDSVQGNAQGMDPYAYVGENPETRTDPTGEKIDCGSSCGGSLEKPNANDCKATSQVLQGGQCVTPPSDPHCDSRACFNANGTLIGTRGGGGKLGVSFTVVKHPTPTSQQIQRGQKTAFDIAGKANIAFNWIAVILGILGSLVLIYGSLLLPDIATTILGAYLIGIGMGLIALGLKAAGIAGIFSQEEDYGLSWFTKSDLDDEENEMAGLVAGTLTPSVGSWLLTTFAKQLPKMTSPTATTIGIGFLVSDLLGTIGLLGLIAFFTNQQQRATLT